MVENAIVEPINAPTSDNSEDENDFILPEDLEMRIWENIYGPLQEEEEIPFIQVPENIEQYRITPNENLCIICFEGLATHAPIPCGHKVLYENCISELVVQRCPL
ncbi:RING-type domain-containing protein, partial [Aphis craccivora]